MTAGSDIERLTFYVRLWSSRHEKMTAIIESMERKARQKSMLPRTWERRSWKHVLGCREFPPFFNYTVSHNPATQLGDTLCKDIRTTCFYRIYMSKLINTKYRTNKRSNGTISASSTRPADAVCCSWKPASELHSWTARDHYVLSLRPPVAEPRNKRWRGRKMIMFIITCDAREDH